MKKLVLMLSGVLFLLGCGSSQTLPPQVDPAYGRLLQTLYKGTVPTLLPAELAGLRREHPGTIVLDTRAAAEYRVSHLEGARFIDYDAFSPAAVQDLPRTQPVVVYCSVGYRSERIGEKLKALGFRDVRNLYGGIFQWINEAYPVVDEHGRTSRVHPYSALWAPWVRRGEKAYK